MLRWITGAFFPFAILVSSLCFAEQSPQSILQELVQQSHGTLRPAVSRDKKHFSGLQFLDTENKPISPTLSFSEVETASLLVFTTDETPILSIKIYTCCGAELSGTTVTSPSKWQWRVDDMAFSNVKFRVEIKFADGDLLFYSHI